MYITITEADEYFSGRLHSEQWFAADATTKEIALTQAGRVIDRLPLKGRPVELGQEHAFPRAYISEGAPLSEHTFELYSGWYVQTDIPDAVKWAVCEEALTLMEETGERAELIQAGVASFSIGDLSETYRPNAMRGLHSLEAQEYMRPYIAGAAAIL